MLHHKNLLRLDEFQHLNPPPSLSFYLLKLIIRNSPSYFQNYYLTWSIYVPAEAFYFYFYFYFFLTTCRHSHLVITLFPISYFSLFPHLTHDIFESLQFALEFLPHASLRPPRFLAQRWLRWWIIHIKYSQYNDQNRLPTRVAMLCCHYGIAATPIIRFNNNIRSCLFILSCQ